MKPFIPVTCVLLSCAACSHNPGASDRHYRLTGEVKSLDPTEHTASIDGAAIPNYMEAMRMDYPVKSKAEFSQLRVGEHIQATINIHSDDSYDLTDVRPVQGKK